MTWNHEQTADLRSPPFIYNICFIVPLDIRQLVCHTECIGNIQLIGISLFTDRGGIGRTVCSIGNIAWLQTDAGIAVSVDLSILAGFRISSDRCVQDHAGRIRPNLQPPSVFRTG